MRLKLTKYIVAFIFMASMLTMAGLSWKLFLPIRSFFFHATLLTLLISSSTVLSFLVAKLRPAVIGQLGVFMIWSSLSLLLMITYVLFYISCSYWGIPMDISMVLSLVDELPYLIDNLPVNNTIVWAGIITPIVLILLFWGFIAGKLQNEQQNTLQLKAGGSGYRKSRWALASLILIPLGLLLWTKVYFINSRFRARHDPVMSLLFFDDISGHLVTGAGLQHAKAKQNYPEDLITKRPNVILIVCDALRADHLGAYGYQRPTSPYLDSLAAMRNSYLHPRYFAISSFSFTGISSILSSRELLTSNSFMVHEVLKKQGYRTAFTFSGDFVHFYGLKQYIGKELDSYHDGYTYQQEPYAGTISSANDRVLIIEQLNRLPVWDGKPVFKYLHFMSTHQIAPVEDQARIYLPDEVSFNAPKAGPLTNNYDNRVLQFDAFLRETISILEKKNFMKNTLVIITSDHGQALLEEEQLWHGNSTAMPETYIPLLIFGTGDLVLPQRKSNTINDQTDLAPTITDLLGLPKPSSWEGTSIFQDTVSGPVFQSQRSEYSVLQEYEGQLYKLIYQQKTQKARLKNISDPSTPKTTTDEVPEALRLRWMEELRTHYKLPN